MCESLGSHGHFNCQVVFQQVIQILLMVPEHFIPQKQKRNSATVDDAFVRVPLFDFQHNNLKVCLERPLAYISFINK